MALLTNGDLTGPSAVDSGPAYIIDGIVRAAGGVVWREEDHGIEVLLVHRPKYDDWTLPKGKLDAGETDEEAALREVWEETGLECVLGAEVTSVSYIDRKNRPKIVRYWTMSPVGGMFNPTDEVDEVRWLTVADAPGLLSYDRDREVLSALPD